MSWVNIEGHRLHVDRIIDYQLTKTELSLWYARTPDEVVHIEFVKGFRRAAYQLDVAKGLRQKVKHAR